MQPGVTTGFMGILQTFLVEKYFKQYVSNCKCFGGLV
jgi:hypothetical protein